MTDSNAVLFLRDLQGGEKIKVPGVIGADGSVAFGLADRVPAGNQAGLSLFNPHGGVPIDIPVTIQNDGRVVMGTSPDTNVNYAGMVINRLDGGQPFQVGVAIDSSGVLTIALATFENPNVAPVYDSSEIGSVNSSTVVVRFSVNVSSADFSGGVTIKKNTVAQNILSATRQANHARVYYVLDTPVDANDVVTWEYAKASGDIASEFDSTELENVSAKTATNNVAGDPPLFVSAEIGVVGATTVAVEFDANVSAPGDDYSTGVVIKVNTVPAVIASGTRQGDHHFVRYVIPAVDADDVVTWEYSATTGVIVNEADGSDLATLTAQAVTNTVAGVPPTFTSAEVGTVNATTVAATFSVNLKATGDDYETGFTIKVNAGAVAIGTATRQVNHAIIYFTVPAVVNGDVVTIEYAAPAGVILNEADSAPMVTFGAQAVTNNVAP